MPKWSSHFSNTSTLVINCIDVSFSYSRWHMCKEITRQLLKQKTVDKKINSRSHWVECLRKVFFFFNFFKHVYGEFNFDTPMRCEPAKLIPSNFTALGFKSIKIHRSNLSENFRWKLIWVLQNKWFRTK